MGTDDRKLWTQPTVPFIKVGRLVWSNGVYCSATLVGPRHILTAKHCLPSTPIAGTFSPGYDQGNRFGQAAVIASIAGPQYLEGNPCRTKSDWAVIAFNARLGDHLGWLGVRFSKPALFNKPVLVHMGYPGDKDGGNRPYRQTGTKVHGAMSRDCDSTGPLYTDTDTAGGQFGGPLWEVENNRRYTWGDLSITAGANPPYAGFVSGNQIVDAVNRMKTLYP